MSDTEKKTIIEPRTLKGFRDFGAKEQLARQQMFARIQTVFERFGFSPLSTPALEYKEILMGKYGDEERLVYSFKDNGDRDVAMRYDLTVPLARYVAQNQNQLTYPFKRYQIAPVWRAENTQRGRLREFYQCDVDIVGEDSWVADAEIIACYAAVLTDLGISNFIFKINDRRLFEILAETDEEKAQVLQVIRCVDKADKIGISGVMSLLEERGVGQKLQQKIQGILGAGKGQEALQAFAKISPLASELVSQVQAVISLAIRLGVSEDSIVFDPTIARGLDYYTGTVLECTLAGVEGYGSVVGGGRYDGLLDTFSNKPLKAVGASLGVDRLYEYLEENGKLTGIGGSQVLVANMGQSTWENVVAVVRQLREAGVNAELYYQDGVKLDKQLKYAESKAIPYVVIIGETEKAKDLAAVKNIQTREQQEVPLNNLVSYVKG